MCIYCMYVNCVCVCVYIYTHVAAPCSTAQSSEPKQSRSRTALPMAPGSPKDCELTPQRRGRRCSLGARCAAFWNGDSCFLWVILEGSKKRMPSSGMDIIVGSRLESEAM